MLYRLGALCCVYYILAQLAQEITLRLGINDSATGAAEIAQRLTPLDQFRAVAILLAFTFVPILAAYVGVALRRYRARPGASVLGLLFVFLWIGLESVIRSIDLFLVSRTWAVAHQAALIETWDGAVGAAYFALLAAGCLASVCFAIATWDEARLDRLVAIAFAATALYCASRLLAGYLGQTWLDPLGHATHFPVILLQYGTLAVWLWRGTTKSA